MEKQLLQLINNERALRGIGVLILNSRILNAAREHSQDMADHSIFSHIGSDGSSLGDRLDKYGYNWAAAGENIAQAQTMAQLVFNAWISNIAQKNIMLDPTFQDAAVGCGYNSKSPGKSYWTFVAGHL